ncbi:MAG: SLC13 family permease [Planctomycetota bacterium]|nr:MAG: SLC13 family permease [Planctomycetota bacterium]
MRAGRQRPDGIGFICVETGTPGMFTDQPSIQIAIALITVFGLFITMLTRRNAPTEILFLGALAIFIVTGVMDPERAWHSLADPAVIAIAGLLIVSGALRTSGVLDSMGRWLLGRLRTETAALTRLSAVVIACSAFLLNTAIVAMLMPLVMQWCRSRHISPSKLLLPISYCAILGGTCTLVGTSTNFVVNGTLRDFEQVYAHQSPDELSQVAAAHRYPLEWIQTYAGDLRPMAMTDISWVGIPCAIAGAAWLVLFGRRLLPNRKELLDSLGERRREYLVEMLVTPECQLVGQSVEEGGLRHLPGLFLIEIDREGEIITPVKPTDRLRANDRLVFTGVVSTIVDLERIQGLVPAADLNYETAAATKGARMLVEVVLSPSSPLVGTTIRDANFRQHYGAAVVAVHRNGQRLPSKIGDIELQPGDTLLLQTQPGFVRAFRNEPDFYLVSGVEDGDARRHHKAGWAIGITLGLIVWLFSMPVLGPVVGPVLGAQLVNVLTVPTVAILIAALALVAVGCLSPADARRALDFPMLLTVGAAIGVGRALYDCGAADSIAHVLMEGVGDHPYVALVVLFFVTVLFTEMMSNVAVAASMIPVALGMASQLGVSPRPFIMAVAVAASLSFMSPIGYQTNLMVMGPGGYRPVDYIKSGAPLSLLVGTIALILIPMVWPF